MQETKTAVKTQLWKSAHPKAEVPSIISDNAQLEDVSWRNDAMPSFQLKGTDSASQIDLRLWVDYADKTLSDVPDWARYAVIRNNWDTNQSETLYSGEDAQAAIDALLATIN